MATAEALLTWGGLAEHYCTRPDKEEQEQESMATMRAMLQAMTWASQAKDAALEDLQRRLSAAVAQAEQGRAREAGLLRRAEKSEEAEEALASQMAEVEAEAFTRITETSTQPSITSQLSTQVEELQRRLKSALEEAGAWARRCEGLEQEAEQYRFREATLQRRVERAEEAEEALASQMAELEAEAFTRITENARLLAGYNGQESNSLREERSPETQASSQLAELERRLEGAEEALEAVHAKLRQAEEKNWSLERRLAHQLLQESEKAVTVRRKQGEAALLSLSLQDLAGFVKLKLWNPSSLTLISRTH